MCLRGHLLSDSILYKWELCVHVCPFTWLPQGQTCSGVEQVCQQTLLDLLELPAQGGRERYSSYLGEGKPRGDLATSDGSDKLHEDSS